jgi:hypothetical protein
MEKKNVYSPLPLCYQFCKIHAFKPMFACITACNNRVCGAPAALRSLLSRPLSLDRRNMKWKSSFLLTGCRRRLGQRRGPVHEFLDGPSGLVDPVSEARVDLAHAESAAALLCCSLKTHARPDAGQARPWIVLIMRPARRRSSRSRTFTLDPAHSLVGAHPRQAIFWKPTAICCVHFV